MANAIVWSSCQDGLYNRIETRLNYGNAHCRSNIAVKFKAKGAVSRNLSNSYSRNFHQIECMERRKNRSKHDKKVWRTQQ